MKYLFFIVFLLVMIITAGCVSENQINFTPTSTPTPVTISKIDTPNNSPGIETVPTTIAISTNGYSQKGQIQCGESRCPPNWFCCNNVCYDPKEGNTGFCCGGKVCPVGWGCYQTSYGNLCYSNPQLQYTNPTDQPIPGYSSEYCTSNYAGTVYNPSSKTCDSNNYIKCAYNYPGSHYNPITNKCLYSTTKQKFGTTNVTIATLTDSFLIGEPITFFISYDKGDYFELMVDGPSYKSKTLIIKKVLPPSKFYSFTWNPGNSLIPGKYTIYAFDEWEESYDTIDVWLQR